MNEYNTVDSAGRVTVKRDLGATVIEIPAKKNWPQILFMMVWLCGWALGEYFAINTLINTEGPLIANAFIIFWLVGWTFAGGTAFYTVLWRLFGREIVTVESGMMTIHRTVFGLKGKRKFQTDLIKNLKILPDHARGIRKLEGKKVEGRSGGKIRFEYDHRIIRFGMDLAAGEAEKVVEGLRQSGWIRSKAFESEEQQF